MTFSLSESGLPARDIEKNYCLIWAVGRGWKLEETLGRNATLSIATRQQQYITAVCKKVGRSADLRENCVDTVVEHHQSSIAHITTISSLLCSHQEV